MRDDLENEENTAFTLLSETRIYARGTRLSAYTANNRFKRASNN